MPISHVSSHFSPCWPWLQTEQSTPLKAGAQFARHAPDSPSHCPLQVTAIAQPSSLQSSPYVPSWQTSHPRPAQPGKHTQASCAQRPCPLHSSSVHVSAAAAATPRSSTQATRSGRISGIVDQLKVALKSVYCNLSFDDDAAPNVHVA